MSDNRILRIIYKHRDPSLIKIVEDRLKSAETIGDVALIIYNTVKECQSMKDAIEIILIDNPNFELTVDMAKVYLQACSSPKFKEFIRRLEQMEELN
jgi:hypothetical protein